MAEKKTMTRYEGNIEQQQLELDRLYEEGVRALHEAEDALREGDKQAHRAWKNEHSNVADEIIELINEIEASGEYFVGRDFKIHHEGSDIEPLIPCGKYYRQMHQFNR